ncbi:MULTISPECIES: ribonuclease III [Porcipelethomonas]|jgi:ribonuclease-3|uniref:ribonuclease III n=1 Tax=Porcipelethomonas TaxID=2981643 RepID=UPI000820F47B|nr:ribonuclease III [Porcipelethomonas ammoniilytica]MCU6720053.1 ribonuclease III [Porcipelethomonas ammoniilytica]MEE0187061.1 ribonuclease III [Oscillospiraceae bacterium]SCJ00670.1 Ribonuclease 3 [uncultured Ruminococcus sp.]
MENLDKNLEEFQGKIRYYFNDKELLIEALSHSSYANEKRKGRNSNERLEFLGDSVLSIVVSQYLFEHFTHLPEGELTKIRASLVCEKSLYEFAKQIDLGEHILLGKGEENTGGRERVSILADAFEAVIAAVFLDGGLEAARRHILKFIPKDIDDRKPVSFSDHKTILQEIIQKNPEEKVEYKLVGQSGPDHNKAFKVQVRLNSNVIGTGIGRSKKEAEQMAAKEALELMGYESL